MLARLLETKDIGGLSHAAFGLQEVKFASGDDAEPGAFTGYGSVFNNEDGGGDVILKGAFKKSLAEWKSKKKLPKMLLQHGGYTAEGMLPIGVWTSMEEDDYGLKVGGRVYALDTDRGKTVYEGMKAGALDGLSIGYRAIDYRLGKKPDEPWRTIKELTLYEVSVVLFGMNDKALIDSVKDGQLPTEREFERWLMRDAGFSAIEAKTIISSGFKSLAGARDAAGGEGELADLLRQARSALR